MPTPILTENSDSNSSAPEDNSRDTVTVTAVTTTNVEDDRLEKIAQRLQCVEEMLKQSRQLDKDNKYKIARLEAEIKAVKDSDSNNSITKKITPLDNTFWGR